MARYLCMFLNHADEVYGSDFMDAENDDEAIARAQSIYRNNIGKGFELWRDDRLIHSHTNGRPV
jgi:hypothetical protein